METEARLLFLGTGGSMGIPVIGCSCAVCLSDSPYNRRLRPSALLMVKGKNILIDVGPDFRIQALMHKIHYLDGILITHLHYDHTAGIDELRVYYMHHRTTIPCLLSEATAQELNCRYHYLFAHQGPANQLTSRIELQTLEKERGSVPFLGMKVGYVTFEHAGIPVNGFRFGNLGYISDIKNYPETIFDDLAGVETLVLSALRFQPMSLHFTIEEAVSFAQKLGAKTTWLTHISHEVDHEATNRGLPSNIQLAYDGLSLPFTATLT
ncbi:MAG: MBL fold metallo-hydrolase [Waddliaceae bacterium]